MSLLDNEVLPGGASRQEQWRPSLGLCSVLTGVMSVLQEPNPSSPANMTAARLFTKLLRLYNYISPNVNPIRSKIVCVKLRSLNIDKKKSLLYCRDFTKYVDKNLALEKWRIDRKLADKPLTSTLAELKLSPTATLTLEPNGKIDSKEPEVHADQCEEDTVVPHLPAEPPKLITIRFRTPTGVLQRRFPASIELSDILLFFGAQGYRPGEHRLLADYPRRNLSDLPQTTTVQDLKLSGMTTLTLEPSVENDDSD